MVQSCVVCIRATVSILTLEVRLLVLVDVKFRIAKALESFHFVAHKLFHLVMIAILASQWIIAKLPVEHATIIYALFICAGHMVLAIKVISAFVILLQLGLTGALQSIGTLKTEEADVAIHMRQATLVNLHTLAVRIPFIIIRCLANSTEALIIINARMTW